MTRNLMGSKGIQLREKILELIDVRKFPMAVAAKRLGMSYARVSYQYKKAKGNGV